MHNSIKSFEDITGSLDNLHIEDIKNPEHPSYIFKTEGYTLLIIRFFELDEDGLKGISIPYLIQESAIYRYDRNEDNFAELKDHHAIIDSIKKHLQQSE